MPPRKKKAPAKAEADDFDDDNEDFIDDGAKDEPSKKRKAPKKATPAKTKPIEEPHIALEGPKWNLVPPHLMYRCVQPSRLACNAYALGPSEWHVSHDDVAHREAEPKSAEKIAAFDFVRPYPTPELR